MSCGNSSSLRFLRNLPVLVIRGSSLAVEEAPTFSAFTTMLRNLKMRKGLPLQSNSRAAVENRTAVFALDSPGIAIMGEQEIWNFRKYLTVSLRKPYPFFDPARRIFQFHIQESRLHVIRKAGEPVPVILPVSRSSTLYRILVANRATRMVGPIATSAK
jgi:hypothetical protein